MAPINNLEHNIGPAFSKYPLPARPEKIFVTRDMAGDWLDHRAQPDIAHNRKLSKHHAGRLAKVMDEGGWKTTHQGIAFDTNGLLIDGQHRLTALRLSRLDGLELWVFPDVPRDTFDVMDTNHSRQASQLYGGKYGALITAAARYLMGEPGVYERLTTPAAVLAAAREWPELNTHAGTASLAVTKARIPGPQHLAVLALAERSIFRNLIPSWKDGILTGVNLSEGDARLHLRNRFNSSTSSRVVAMSDRAITFGLIAKAWNFHVIGQEVKILKVKADELPINIVGLK